MLIICNGMFIVFARDYICRVNRIGKRVLNIVSLSIFSKDVNLYYGMVNVFAHDDVYLECIKKGKQSWIQKIYFLWIFILSFWNSNPRQLQVNWRKPKHFLHTYQYNLNVCLNVERPSDNCCNV